MFQSLVLLWKSVWGLLHKYCHGGLSAKRFNLTDWLKLLSSQLSRNDYSEKLPSGNVCMNVKQIKGYKCARMSAPWSRLLWTFTNFHLLHLFLHEPSGGAAGQKLSLPESAGAYHKKSPINERLQGDSATAYCTVTAWKIYFSFLNHTLASSSW